MFAKKILILVAAVFVQSFSSYAQQDIGAQGSNISIGKSYILPSKVLSENLTIKIALPDGYEGSSQSYPTIYILEGQWFFSYGVNMIARLSEQEDVPAAIIVGLEMANPSRFGLLETGSAGAGKMLDFLEQEVFAFMAENFRVSERRTLMGWEYGGGFTIHALVKRPHMFDAFIAASPFPINMSEFDLTALAALATKPMWADKFLYFGVSKNEGPINTAVSALLAVLREKMARGLRWEHRTLEGDELTIHHRLTAYPLFREGLSKAYADYRPLKYDGEDGLAKLKALGGFNFVKTYSSARARKYGTADKIPSNTSFAFLRMARTFDEMELFDQFVKGADIYYGRWNPNWYHRFAQFYLKHGKMDEAADMYQRTVEMFPQSLIAISGLAGVYEALDMKSQAIEAYQKAVTLAEQQESSSLVELRKALNAIHR